MKTVKSVLSRMAGFSLVMLIVTGVVYPTVVTAATNVAFGHEANGSVTVGKDDTKYGSAPLAQEFTENQYLWGRAVNVGTGTLTDENGESPAYAGASNKTPAGSKPEAMITEWVEKIKTARPKKGEKLIPVDFVTCSSSGLDPGASPATVGCQAERIVREQDVVVEGVEAVINRYTAGGSLGIFGEPRVNMLKVNLALDELV